MTRPLACHQVSTTMLARDRGGRFASEVGLTSGMKLTAIHEFAAHSGLRVRLTWSQVGGLQVGGWCGRERIVLRHPVLERHDRKFALLRTHYPYRAGRESALWDKTLFSLAS
jgi:hypothetical protein